MAILSFCELRLRLGRVGALLLLLVLPALAAPSGLLAGTLIFSDGFESGDISQWPLAGVPVVTTSAGTTLAIEGTGPQPVDSALVVSDADSANLAAASVTILDPADGLSEVLDGPDCAGLVVTPGPNSLAISGSQPLSVYETCLRSVTWDDTAATPTPGPRTLAFTVDDGTSTSPAAGKIVELQLCEFAISPIAVHFNIRLPTSHPLSMCVQKTATADVTATAGCAWDTVVDLGGAPGWLSILGGSSGVGTGLPQSLTWRVFGNAHEATARSGTITVLRAATLAPTPAVLAVSQIADPAHLCP
ncbi:MAG: hypothetical protein KBI44_19195 [Thermoanaerobaculia bacterium]|nr:hypothetical protein [Thermoanaerobaculia bacterium]